MSEEKPYAQHLTDSQGEVVRCAIITLSDTRTPATDKSGAKVNSLLTAERHAVVEYQVVADEPGILSSVLESLLTRGDVDAILTSGGTGVSRRDQTIPVIERMLDIPLAGFGELFRALSYEQIGSGAILSRAVGGIARGKLLFAMPGSTAAVELAMRKLILPELKHLIHELRK